MSSKARLKILQKISQTNLPNDSVNANITVKGNPSSFTVTNEYPSTILGFGAKNIQFINNIGQILNSGLFYNSNGQVQLSWMKNNQFNFTTSQIPSIELRKIMEICKLMYNYIFTNLGKNYTQELSNQEINAKTSVILNNQNLNGLSASSNKQLSSKLGGNIKNLLIKNLSQMK